MTRCRATRPAPAPAPWPSAVRVPSTSDTPRWRMHVRVQPPPVASIDRRWPAVALNTLSVVIPLQPVDELGAELW